MYETLLRPIEVFQTPQLPSISTVSEKIKLSEIKREEKRLRQIAANKANAAAVASAKRKRPEGEEEEEPVSAVSELGTDKVIRDTKTQRITSTSGADASGSGSGSGTVISSAESSHHKRIKTDNPTGTTHSLSEDLDNTAVFEEEKYDMDVVVKPTVEETDEMDVQVNLAAENNNETDNTTKAQTSKPTPPSRNLRSNPTQLEDGTLIPKINVSKALPEVRGHTSYLTFACLIPNPNHNSNSIADAVSTTATTTTTTSSTPAAASLAGGDAQAVDSADLIPEENGPSA